MKTPDKAKTNAFMLVGLNDLNVAAIIKKVNMDNVVFVNGRIIELYIHVNSARSAIGGINPIIIVANSKISAQAFKNQSCSLLVVLI